MSCAPAVAHRAASPTRPAITAIVALIIAVTAILSTSGVASAAAYAPRVVIVVGPSGGATATYRDRANRVAEQAAAYGASVTKVYTPHATWARVLAAAQGANVFVYLGHGNGWPSPYGPYQGRTKNGLGLNPTDGSGTTSPVAYYGEDLLAAHLRLAPGAVVLLNHLCYASGNGESGAPEPSWDTARKRVDNYAAGFLRARAAAVIADGHTNLGTELAALFGPSQSILGAWRDDPDAHGHERSFASTRTPGASVHLDPDTTTTGFYRSIVTRPGARTGGIRIAAFRGVTKTAIVVRNGVSTTADVVGKASEGATVWITGTPRADAAGRTWAPVMTSRGVRGWVASWLVGFRGSAVATTNVVLRTAPRTTGTRIATIRAGHRATVVKSTRDSKGRLWLSIRTARGSTGWMAGWLVRP